MVKQYKIESGAYTGMECVKVSDYQDINEAHVLLKSDYEQLEQELAELKEKHKKQLKQTRLGVQDYAQQYDEAFTKLEQENATLKKELFDYSFHTENEMDGLKCHIEMLKGQMQHLANYIAECDENPSIGAALADAVEKSIEQSPFTSLREHDARVIEQALKEWVKIPDNWKEGSINYISENRIHEYAQQLRERE
ncbi:MAG: hypothetical protein ACRBB6_04500 [Neptuniibacter sp.]